SLSNLALSLLSKLDFEASEPLLRRALGARQRVLGEEHPDTLASLNNLGMLLEQKGDFVAAERMLRRALEGLDRKLGPDKLDSQICRTSWQRCRQGVEQQRQRKKRWW